MPEQSYTLRGGELALVERVLEGVICDHERRWNPPQHVRQEVRQVNRLLNNIAKERVGATAEVHRGGEGHQLVMETRR